MYSLVLCPPQQTVNYLQITRSKGVCNFLCETFVACVFKFAVCMGSVLISSHVFNNGIALHNCIFLICSWVLHVLFAIKKLWLCSENKKYITRTWGCPLNHWPSLTTWNCHEFILINWKGTTILKIWTYIQTQEKPGIRIFIPASLVFLTSWCSRTIGAMLEIYMSFILEECKGAPRCAGPLILVCFKRKESWRNFRNLQHVCHFPTGLGTML